MTTRKYRPTFVATVTPTEIASSDTVHGQPYSALRDALVTIRDKPAEVRTLMAFGPSSRIAERLEPGVPVELAVQWDGAKLKLVGLPRAAVGGN